MNPKYQYYTDQTSWVASNPPLSTDGIHRPFPRLLTYPNFSPNKRISLAQAEVKSEIVVAFAAAFLIANKKDFTAALGVIRQNAAGNET